MIDELDEFTVEIFKMTGFAFMAPFGRLFFEPMAVFKECGTILFFIYVTVAFSLLILGLMLIAKAYVILELGERKKEHE